MKNFICYIKSIVTNEEYCKNKCEWQLKECCFKYLKKYEESYPVSKRRLNYAEEQEKNTQKNN